MLRVWIETARTPDVRSTGPRRANAAAPQLPFSRHYRFRTDHDHLVHRLAGARLRRPDGDTVHPGRLQSRELLAVWPTRHRARRYPRPAYPDRLARGRSGRA